MLTQGRKARKKMPFQLLSTQKVAYILSRFPVLSETFIQQEILELERQGIHVNIFSLFKPSINKDVEVAWNGQAKVTCLSHYSKLILLMHAVRFCFKNPLRFTRTFIEMVKYYRLEFLIGCRVLLFATFLATQFEHEDIIHMHAHFAWESTSVAQFTHMLTGIPYSFTAHANDIYLSSKTALAFKMRMAQFVVTVSFYNQRYLTELVDQNTAKRIYCIYNGLNLQDFPTHSSNALLTQKPPFILSVCRLVEKKGLYYLLHACRILAEQGYTFTCCIVGDGPQRQELEQKIHELALSNKVVLSGAKSHKQVMEMYQKATIMALPCIVTKNGDRDGLPTVLIESLYMGIPTVSTTVSGIPELISSEINGLLVSPNDSIALAAALARLLDNASLSDHLATNGRKIILERFDLAHNVKYLGSLFYADQGEQLTQRNKWKPMEIAPSEG